ncbi:MAG TPA: DEAD/DEAH box helicase [Actinomycetota bacterium]
MDPERALRELASGDHAGCVVHVEAIPPAGARDEPLDVAPDLAVRLRRLGIDRLWAHQAAGLRAWRAGRNVAVATGTASGKSLVYQLATFEMLLADPRATAIYLFPTKALAQDQLRHLRAFAFPAARAAIYDGDTGGDERAWVRRNANVAITNPDMLHVGILPQHERWAPFLRALRLVVIDEMHVFRGVFGSHVAGILRRLRRLAAHYGAEPAFVAASATIGNPAELAGRLAGLPFDAVTDDGSPRAGKLFAFWNPPLRPDADPDAPERYSTTSQAAALLAGLAEQDVRTIAFTGSRRAAELVASHARDLLGTTRDGRAARAGRVASYRAGYLPEERREVERRLESGDLLGVAATSALELGIDVGGLDACLLAGYPGTVAATWQRVGRAGRGRDRALAVLIANDDPLDQYVVSHPKEFFARPPEAAVVDPANPHVLDAHVGCAAFELPVREEDAAYFGPGTGAARDRLAAAGLLRARGPRWVWNGRSGPAAGIGIRAAGRTVTIVEGSTGRVLGTSDEARAPHTLHPGAIYLHQGEQYAVGSLDLEAAVALVEPSRDPWYTQARDVTDIRIAAVEREAAAGRAPLFFGEVDVSNHVVGFVRRRLYSNELIDQQPLDMPVRSLRTRSVWYTVDAGVLAEAKLDRASTPGAAHAAEHAAIGLMPLFAMCDRWDVGGVSTALHPDTGACTVFVYDGYPGGAGFAERSFVAGAEHLRVTMETIDACACEHGCPSCVHSPKCGNGNEPLDKAGAVRLLAAILRV